MILRGAADKSLCGFIANFGKQEMGQIAAREERMPAGNPPDR
jgi:hypothetical protein